MATTTKLNHPSAGGGAFTAPNKLTLFTLIWVQFSPSICSEETFCEVVRCWTREETKHERIDSSAGRDAISEVCLIRAQAGSRVTCRHPRIEVSETRNKQLDIDANRKEKQELMLLKVSIMREARLIPNGRTASLQKKLGDKRASFITICGRRLYGRLWHRGRLCPGILRRGNSWPHVRGRRDGTQVSSPIRLSVLSCGWLSNQVSVRDNKKSTKSTKILT